MKIQIHQRFESGLPADDDHPYRTGAWRPQQTEYDAWDLEVVGEIPEDLGGVYVRNTENPLLPAVDRYHSFDGDGMLHSISFAGGELKYRDRFVRTEGFAAEREAGEPLPERVEYASIGTCRPKVQMSGFLQSRNVRFFRLDASKWRLRRGAWCGSSPDSGAE